MPYTYRPILRSKAGEANALRRLSPAAKARTVPLITVLPEPPDSFGATAGSAWSGQPLGLDGHLSDTVFKAMFDTLGKEGAKAMPIVSEQHSASYVAAASKVIGKFAPGLVVTTSLAGLQTVGGWTAAHGWSQNTIDLVLTLGDISALDPGTLYPYVSYEIAKCTTPPFSWRSVTVAASSAPQDYSGLSAGRTVVPRREWDLWQTLALIADIDFGDSGHVHPSLEEPPGFVMANATVSTRYTINGSWIILKGRQTKGASGQPMGEQYLRHARTLVKETEFDRLPSCWADDHISAIAAGTATPGNRTTWATIGMNRHIEFVANHLP